MPWSGNPTPIESSSCRIEFASSLRVWRPAGPRRRRPPEPGAVEASLDDFASMLDALRSDGITRGLSGDAAARLFALGFAFEQLRQHLQDLGSRSGECATTE